MTNVAGPTGWPPATFHPRLPAWYFAAGPEKAARTLSPPYRAGGTTHAELESEDAAAVVVTKAKKLSQRTLDERELSKVFGIDAATVPFTIAKARTGRGPGGGGLKVNLLSVEYKQEQEILSLTRQR